VVAAGVGVKNDGSKPESSVVVVVGT